MPYEDAGEAYMNHAGAPGGCYPQAAKTPAEKIVDVENHPQNHVSQAMPWVRSMDDNSLQYYLRRETRRVNELHHQLEITQDFLEALEQEAVKRGLGLYG